MARIPKTKECSCWHEYPNTHKSDNGESCKYYLCIKDLSLKKGKLTKTRCVLKEQEVMNEKSNNN